jgi:coenzyme PQQ precursor peptide PqqA
MTRRILMTWTKPDFVEITLNMEVTAYVNTDEPTGLRKPEPRGTSAETGTRPPYSVPSAQYLIRS